MYIKYPTVSVHFFPILLLQRELSNLTDIRCLLRKREGEGGGKEEEVRRGRLGTHPAHSDGSPGEAAPDGDPSVPSPFRVAPCVVAATEPG